MHDVLGAGYAVKKVTDVKSVAILTYRHLLKLHTVIFPHCDVGQLYELSARRKKYADNV